MTERKLKLMDIRELLLHLRAHASDRQIQKDTGLNRRTIKRYREWARHQGLLDGPLPTPEELSTRLQATLPEKTPPQNSSSAESYREQIQKLLDEKVEVGAIYQRLSERGFTGSYSSVYRLVRAIQPTPPNTVARVERKPGEEAQVDFGYAGRMIDPQTGQLRKTWAFVMILSWSCHVCVEFVWDQKVETWLRCHHNAFEFFGGIPARIVLDNLKAAIIKAIWDDPQVQATYQECAAHYGFLLSPCRVRTPEQKGKVEQGGVHYVCRNFLVSGFVERRITGRRFATVAAVFRQAIFQGLDPLGQEEDILVHSQQGLAHRLNEGYYPFFALPINGTGFFLTDHPDRFHDPDCPDFYGRCLESNFQFFLDF